MVVCEPCANINFENTIIHPVARVDHIIATAEKGCTGCIFFKEALEQAGYDIDDSEDKRTLVVLQCLSEKSNRVNVHLVQEVEDEASDAEVACQTEDTDAEVELRLCSVHGVERALTWDVDAEEDELSARLISAHADYNECFDVARGWLERCTRTHGPECALKQNAPLPTRLIHIPKEYDQPLQLRETKGMTGQYVTLSYVWGRGTVFKTTRDNITSRKEGFWPQDLPKSVRDAVKITRKMGFEYLWVDALCITQGDSDDWNHESALMAGVYGNSVFTISADDARDTDDGILKSRWLLRSHQFGLHENLCLQELEKPWECITDGHIYSRGWALQERVLSVRVLHFLVDQISWECNTTIYGEGYHGRLVNPEDHFGKFAYTKQFHHHPTRRSHADVLSQLNAWYVLFEQFPNESKTQSDERYSGHRNSMVQELAVRSFTVPTDRLAGISGIATALAIPELGEYFVGVWECNPFLSMGWHCRWSQNRPSTYRSPSWSWVWTKHQLNWHPETWDTRDAESETQWATWNATWGPRLLDRDIRLEGPNPRGDVLEGTSITVSGYCRRIFLQEVEGIEYDWEGFGFAHATKSDLGTKVHLDYKPNYLEVKASFDREAKCDNEGSAREYMCVQILKERKRSDFNPKVIGLIVEETEEEEAPAFRRVGIVAFDFGEEEGWEKKSLKLV